MVCFLDYSSLGKGESEWRVAAFKMYDPTLGVLISQQ